MANGWITIGTELKTDKFDRQIASLEKKMEDEEKKKFDLNFEVKQDAFIEAKKQYDELTKKVETYKRQLETIKEMPQYAKEHGYQLPTATYFEKLNETKFAYSEAIQELQKQEGVLYKITNEYNSQKSKIDEINAKISEYKQKAESIRFNKQQAEIEQVKKGFDGVGSSIQRAVRSAGRMVLSIIGIRTGLAMLRSASSELASYDAQYATNLEYIRFALAQMIAPILRYIVNLVATILSYINAILSAWFGVNLFANSSAKAFQKIKSGAGGASKAVKEIKKQLAGFDEITMLSDTSSGGGGGGAGGGITSPSFDLGSDVKIPKWLQWIIDNKDLILAILAGIGAGILAIKLGLGAIKALGIGLIITGVIRLIQNLIKYLNDPSWKNFGKIIMDIGLIIIGVGAIIGELPVVIAGAIIAILGLIISNWEKIKEFLQRGIDWLTSKIDWVRDYFGIVGEIVYRTFINILQLMLNFVDNIFVSIKMIFDGFIKFFKGVFTGDWKMAFEGLKQIFFAFINMFQTTISGVWNFLLGIFQSVLGVIKQVVIDPVIRAFQSLWDNIKRGGKWLFETIVQIFDAIKNWINDRVVKPLVDIFNEFVEIVKWLFGGIIERIKAVFDPDTYRNFANSFIEWWNNTFIGRLIKDLKLKINATGNFSLGGGGGGGASYSGGRALGAIYFPPKMKLWTGGLINMPGKGVPLGSNIGGERGAEGVIPLTQNQAMSKLGYEIGRHVTVNLTNITQMNGRVIGRELKTVQNEQNFALNN